MRSLLLLLKTFRSISSTLGLVLVFMGASGLGGSAARGEVGVELSEERFHLHNFGPATVLELRIGESTREQLRPGR